MNGYFSEEALQRFAEMASQTQSADFAEGDTYDFTRCVRPDGTAYGTRGKCKKGSEQAKQVVAPAPRKPRAAKPAAAKRGAAGYNSASDKERADELDKYIKKGSAGKPQAATGRQAEINARLKQIENEQKAKKTGSKGYEAASDKERAAALDKEMGDSGKYGAEREKPSAKQAATNARAKQLGF